MRQLFGIINLGLFFAAWCIPLHGLTDDCSSPLRDGVFNSTEIRESGKSHRSFLTWQCSHTFSTHKDAIDAGAKVGTIVYGVPIKVNGTFSKSETDTWKKENCSSSDLRTSEEAATFSLVREVSPELVNAWATCMAAKSSPVALECKLTPVGSSSVFEAKWRRTTGDNTAPIVKSWSVSGGSCTPTFTVNETMGENAKQATCTSKPESDFVVMLETQRGSCWKSVFYEPTIEVLHGLQVLKASTTIKADIIDIKAGTEIVTNGHYLALVADKEIRVSGSPKIVSFKDRTTNSSKHGRHGSNILIQAPKITGTTVFIENFGENGLKGEMGPQGEPGPQGSNGRGGIWKKLQGCVEKHEAGPGGQGYKGGPGLPGGDAGNGGTVTLSVKSGLRDGAMERIKVTNIMPGVPGDGGDGGKGGDGGPGGNSDSPRSNVCDGVGPGLKGDNGPKGDDGPQGRIGAMGRVVIF